MRLFQSRAPYAVLMFGVAVAAMAAIALSVSANDAHTRRVRQATDVLRNGMLTELHALETSLSAVRDAAAVAMRDAGPDAPWLPDSEAFAAVFTAGFANGTLGSARAASVIRLADTDGTTAYVVEAISPLAGNEQALGFDLASEERRRMAVERARDTGSPTITAPIDLVQGGEQPAVLLFVPAYDTVEIPKTAPVRRSRFVCGFTVVLEPHMLLQTTVASDLALEVGLLDLGQIGVTDPSIRADGELLGGQVPTDDPVALDLHAGDRRWRLVTAAGAGFGGPDRLPTVVAASSLVLLTLVLALLVDAQRSREARTKALVEERTRDLRRSQDELRRANTRLREADDLKTSFLVTVSHELRTPLAAIRGFTTLLRGHRGEPTAEERAAYIDQLAASTDGLTDLLHEVLEFAEIEKRGPSGVALDFNAGTVVADVVNRQPPSHQIEVVGGGHAHGDPKAVMHALANVLANARAYAPAGSAITVRIRRGGGHVTEIVIDDEGSGIPVEERERVFERFHRGAAASNPGTGIGLTLARKLLEGMGGGVVADQAPGGGARLILSVPGPQHRPQPADVEAQQAL